jgi:hypothetical protein
MEIPQPEYDDLSRIRIGFAHGLAWYNLDCTCVRLDGNSNTRDAFPSWSWTFRKGIETCFNYFDTRMGGGSNVPYYSDLCIAFSADISVKIDKATTKTIVEFVSPFMENLQDKAITENLRYLHLKSLVAKWSVERKAKELKARNILVILKSPRTDKLPYWLEFRGQSITGFVYSANPDESTTEGLAVLLFVSAESEGIRRRSGTRSAKAY